MGPVGDAVPQLVAAGPLRLELIELGDVEVPGPPYLYSETPWRVSRPAPLQGQHTEEVLMEAGYSRDDVTQMRARGITG